MTSLARIQALYDKAVVDIEKPIEGIDPKYKRQCAQVSFTRSMLKALAIVLKAAQSDRRSSREAGA